MSRRGPGERPLGAGRRPHTASTRWRAWPNTPAGIHQAWIISHGFGDQHGQTVANAAGILRYCTTSSGDLSDTCVARHHLFQAFVYEPASRFWALQGIETAVFVTLTGLLTALAVWLIRRRLT